MQPAGERWARVKELFEAAVELDPNQRAPFLDNECGGDAALRAEIESLLESDELTGGFIEQPAFAIPRDLFPDNAEESFVGRQFGAYEVIREIGRGGLGAVYLAARADDEYRKQVAIKVIRRGLDTDDIIRRFRNERQILAQLDHPNIARLIDGGTTDDGLPYFVMEYVNGEPINAYCDANALPTAERLTLFRKVCAAVTYAHQNLVIHRDLKPSNILVTQEGEPKLLDFGIAKLLGAGDELFTQTIPALRVMTPEYASPEQVKGDKLMTTSDVYSLGVLLYELLTGQRPYRLKTRTPEEIARAITEQEPERPSTAATYAGYSPQSGIRNPKSLRGDLDNIVLMAMRKEPARRYSSVGQFSEDIRRHLAALPVVARKDTLSYRAVKFVKRNKIGVAAAALVIFTLLSGIVATAWQAKRATAQARLADEQARFAAHERDRARVEAAKATRINQFLQQMLSFSNQSVYSVAPIAQTKNVTVNQMLDEIAPRIEAELADQPEVRAQILRTIASAYASQGIYDKAEKNYRSALDTQTRIFGTDHAETAATMTQFGVLALRQGKIAEADQLLENAVAFYRRQQARQAPDFRAVNLVTAMNFLGAVRFTSIDVQSGAAILEEALQIAENANLQGNERFALAAVQGDVGLYLTRVGELERADRLLRESLTIHRQLSEYPRWEMGATLASLGELYNRKNQPDQALEFLLESERIYRQTLGDKNRYLAFNLQHQAIALSLQKNFTAAEPKARQQLAIYLEVVPDNKLVAAIPKSVLGIVLVGNKRFDEAEDYLREGLQGLGQSPIKNHFINVQVTIALSQCLLNQNRLPEAEQFALAALAEARQNLGEQNPFVETAAESLAKIHERQGKLK
jgi:serine/threonine protein kinase/type II secretory pathway pseudopilin PulG